MTAGQEQLLALILTALGVVFIPLLLLMVRVIIKWTKVEARLEELTTDMKSIVTDKDKTHTEMLTQMTNDRRATDKRLRWLEENVWNSRKGVT